MPKKLPKPQHRSLGVKIFGVLLIASSLLVLTRLDFGWYRSILPPMPEHWLRLRFAVSILLRIAGLVTGIGLLAGKEMFRKMGLCISALTFCTIYWRHPFYAFRQTVAHVVSQGAGSAFGTKGLSASEMAMVLEVSTWLAFLTVYLIDLGFAAAYLYYFTRPQVKAQFR